MCVGARARAWMRVCVCVSGTCVLIDSRRSCAMDLSGYMGGVFFGMELGWRWGGGGVNGNMTDI